MLASMMFASVDPNVVDPTVPPASQPVVDTVVDAVVDPTLSPAAAGKGFVSGSVDVIGAIIDNLGQNGYQTGLALVAATAAIIAMLNHEIHKAIVPPVTVGAFWAGWLGWNTVSGQENNLFPDDVDATKLWDVALAGDNGFLIVAAVSCVAAFFLWRKGTALVSRLWLLLGAVLGASFLYHLVEAIRLA